MAAALSALDFLSAPDRHPARPVCVVFGEETFLRRQVLVRLRGAVLAGGDADFSLAVFEGRSAAVADVLEELSTVAMFGGGTRLVVVEDADEFITRHRSELEGYVAEPRLTGVLVLEAKSFPSNTRLYKQLAAKGLVVECGAPSDARLSKWLATWARQVHRVELAPGAADMLVDLVGPELGLLDQELAKLALTAGPDGKVTAESVRELVGTWRTKTTWDMLDAALAGDVRGAMTQLDRLLLAGENEVPLLAQISATLRRLAAATRLVLQAEATGRRTTLAAALEEAGVKGFVVRKTEQQLRRIGRQRGSQLYEWLLDADLALKGASSLPPRLVLERLIVRLAT
ncbi:MAG: DNA polymerase III subunit delta [Thermoguttaceae bacterium]|nr:DNA polymerase III subunit delta [Thermoguttaceae bacterium]